MKLAYLLSDKFFYPPTRCSHPPRPHLVHWLEDKLVIKFLLISVSARFSKTSFLFKFLSISNRPFEWYQLNSSASAPTTFMTYFIEDLRRRDGSIEQGKNMIGHNASFESSQARIASLSYTKKLYDRLLLGKEG
jgi:ATP/maltotriose-dependent transcriptional regulator MalT